MTLHSHTHIGSALYLQCLKGIDNIEERLGKRSFVHIIPCPRNDVLGSLSSAIDVHVKTPNTNKFQREFKRDGYRSRVEQRSINHRIERYLQSFVDQLIRCKEIVIR